MKIFILVILFLTILLPAFGAPQVTSGLRFVAVEEPPANYTDSHGQFTGFSTEVILRLQQRLGLDKKIEVMPESRALKTAGEEQDIVLFSISRTASREQDFHWLQEVIRKNWVLYSHKGYLAQLSSLKSLPEERVIAVVRGDIRELWLMEHQIANLVSVTNYAAAVGMLLSDRVDYVLYEAPGMAITTANMKIPLETFQQVMTVNQSRVYIALSRQLSHKSIPLKLKQVFTMMYSEGELQQLAQRWAEKMQLQYSTDFAAEDGVLVY